MLQVKQQRLIAAVMACGLIALLTSYSIDAPAQELSQSGPQGATGPAGPTGPTGPTGPAPCTTAGAFFLNTAASTPGCPSTSNLFWDNSNNRMGIGIATPSRPLDVFTTATADTTLLGVGTTGSGGLGMNFGVVGSQSRVYLIKNGNRYFNIYGTGSSNAMQIDFNNSNASSFGGAMQVPTVNYVATENGANNAIACAASSGPTLTAGLRVAVKLAHTLQAGANTFAYNGGGALAIKSHRNTANDIGTAYASGGIIELAYDGTQWEDMSQ